ncbi:uncharacterized protein SPPG_03998 [Spizellomyces punctatus DAOM BR117]|uniref:RNA polymerase-associated protein LEO1 n=1 Tax=Spizellomyces punctatus (strain DAOM BR117) TaxID=645134 RepID=A0A0L0HIL8_SPIPD|nr:uncharacterized protein SPPG_03998 [Spizellomyces punctatus DAOM BR117]KND00898.1 hypothetical protein SPPG_03998 [Spizellomyces punctatus DAOM BR117]|eukprot:XP_016608937.1 hypothetical protein SPPG_03998 [Spizellomyces punctatus DAOM BR117]
MAYLHEEGEAARREEEGASHVSVENTIRWRTVRNSDGEETKESNARLVRWSDGTYSLLLGNEFFDVNCTEGAPHQYLTVQFPDEGIFQAQSRVPRTMMFRPYGVNQLVHRKLTREIAKKHEKKIKTKQIVTMMDPEKQREALEKSEMEKLRARRRLEAKRRNATLGARGLTSRDLEDDSEDDELYVRGNANIRQALDKYEDDFVVDDDEDDAADEEEEERERINRERIMKAKRQDSSRRTSQSGEASRRGESTITPKRNVESSDPMDVDDDVDEEDNVMRAKKKRHIISSDEDD